MKVDLNILNGYIEKGLVEKNNHPTLPIAIYNYSRTCQYEGKWDDITLMCRGLVLDNEGNVVAKTFNKFFNMEEHKPEEIPNESFEVFEKMDGSLGICFYYERELTYSERYKIWFTNNYETGMEYYEGNVPNFDDPYYEPTPTTKGEWHIATRGSFTSEQAIKGRELLDKYGTDELFKTYTYLFEIIYPENRIVVSYGTDEKLVLLAAIETETGYEDDTEIYYHYGYDVVKKYNGVNDFTKLKEMISDEAEGYVIRFRNGMRMKIKGDEYVRLHRILTGFSNVDIWEYLKDGKDFNDFLDRVPDEFDHWVKNTKKELESQYETLEREYKWIFKVLMRSPGCETKKGFAEFAKRYKHPSILFKMFDGKDYSDYIWKQIRPIYSKPFWQKDSDNG